MIRRTVDVALALLGALAVISASRPLWPDAPDSAADPAARERLSASAPATVGAVASGAPIGVSVRARARTPFRLRGRQPVGRYGGPPPPAAPPRPAPPRPSLALTGLLLGPEPVVLIQGIPGQEAEVALREGEARGGLRVGTIEAGAVRLEGYDTTWVLRVREVW